LVIAGSAVSPAGAGEVTAAGGGGTAGSAESGSSDWRQVSAGGFHTCGIRTSGRLYCWGNDGDGQLGNGGLNTNQAAPVQVAGGATNWTAVDAGREHICARRTTGRLYCWGDDGFGRLGDGGLNTDQAAPVQVAGGATNWTAVTAGDFHTCARRTTGRLYCWGSDDAGQLGDGGLDTDQAAPVQVAGGATNWTAVTVGSEHTCARRTTGRLYCWGYDGSGQLGDGGLFTEQATPVQVAGGATNWTAVTAAGTHTCARRTTGRLYCWGNDGFGQLGDGGTNTSQAVPVQVAGGATDWTAVTAGQSHTCARITSRRLYCWGSDGSGRLGDGGTNTNQPRPAQVFA